MAPGSFVFRNVTFPVIERRPSRFHHLTPTSSTRPGPPLRGAHGRRPLRSSSAPNGWWMAACWPPRWSLMRTERCLVTTRTAKKACSLRISISPGQLASSPGVANMSNYLTPMVEATCGDSPASVPELVRNAQVEALDKCPELIGFGAPGVARTPDLQIRSLPLYPSELQARPRYPKI